MFSGKFIVRTVKDRRQIPSAGFFNRSVMVVRSLTSFRRPSTSPLRDWLDNLRPGTLLILDEAHHAAPSSGSKYAIDSKITRAVRDLAPCFEHRLFLSATPHNGHSNSFSALLEILDSQRFCRGVKVLGSHLDQVMVRRLKDDVRDIVGGLPKRVVRQIDIDGLSDDAPELSLARLLDQYRDVRQRRVQDATKRKQAESQLLISGLQQRLLSSVEAFARTLRVHRRTMERIWANEIVATESAQGSRPAQYELLAGGLDADDDRAELPEGELEEMEDAQMDAATAATGGDHRLADTHAERRLLDQMEAIAEQGASGPSGRRSWPARPRCVGPTGRFAPCSIGTWCACFHHPARIAATRFSHAPKGPAKVRPVSTLAWPHRDEA